MTSEKLSQLKQDKRRQQIYQAALKILAKKGFHNTKMQDVATKAGLGKGTLYWYFKSKEELFHFVIRSGFEEFNQAVLEAIAKVNNPLEKLRAAWEESLRFYLQNKDHVWILTSFWSVSGLNKLDKQLAADVNEGFDAYRQIIAGVLANARRLNLLPPGDNGRQTHHFMALIDGLLVQRVLGMYADNFEEVQRGIYAEFKRGLVAK